jgi:hypothetical protein
MAQIPMWLGMVIEPYPPKAVIGTLPNFPEIAGTARAHENGLIAGAR